MSNNFSEILARARILNDKVNKIKNTTEYKRVIGVLSGLGFLIAPEVTPLANSKIDINEAINIGKSIEPRVLEVLPAAILSFPKSFLQLSKAPEELKIIVQALRTGKNGPDFEGVSFTKILEAASRPIKNKKRKSVLERRILKSFRLSQTAIKLLKENSKKQKLSNTEYLENLILQAAAVRN